MRASPDFTFWTPEEAVQLLGLKEGFACWAHLCHQQLYKKRMAKVGRSRAYLYLVEAEVAGHRFHKVGLTFSSNPRERDPAAYRKVLASVPVSGHQADAFESAAISWLRMKFKPKKPPVKVCSRGESLTHPMNQMKLFNIIATAAVIGTSFIAPNPAEARNGWMIIGENNGELYHEKFESYAQNRYVNVQVATKPGQHPKTIDCINWTYTFNNDGTGWRDIYPGTLGESSAKRWCR